MGKAKRASIFIRLVSAAGTGFFYVKRKNPRRITEKLEFRKYDPRVNKHVLFTEAKMKTSAAPQVLPDLAISAVKQHWDFSGLLFITRITGPGLLIAAF
uniref:Large ribosomal subunit protein bL33c n=2 Tax=Oryza TaxID=4527 RepID=A0A0E0HFD8_ORYNI